MSRVIADGLSKRATATLPAATTSKAGVMTSADKTKLQSGLTTYVTHNLQRLCGYTQVVLLLCVIASLMKIRLTIYRSRHRHDLRTTL